MDEKLKPCPFCGASPDRVWNAGFPVYVSCKCLQDKSQQHWNKRPIEGALVEALEGMLVAFGHYDIGETRAARAALAKVGRE